MGKTPAFRAIQRALQRAIFLERHPELKKIDPQEHPDFLQERREFLKTSFAYGAAAIPLSALVANCATAPRTALAKNDLKFGVGSSQPPVAVIGAGFAGLTAAYRLTQAGVPCVLFEAQSRVGGRVFTHDRFNADGQFCELGGELVDSKHSDLLALASELGVKWDDFRPFDAKVKKHQFFFKGQRYFDEELARASAPLAARLLKDMQAVFKDMDSPAVSYTDFTPAAEKFDRISLEEYMSRATDVDAWVRDAISMAYLTEYGLDTGDQSCINLMMLIDPMPGHNFGIFGESDEALRIRGGNSRLAEALYAAVERKAKVNFEHRLVRFEDKGSNIELTFDRAGTAKAFTASRVVCTIPFTLLRDVDGVAAFSPRKRQCVSELGYGANTKRMVGYTSRAWRKAKPGMPAASGYTFTDLPSQTLWESSRVQKGRSGVITAFLGGRAAADPNRATVESVLSDMEAIVPGSRALHDGNQVLMRWSANPFAKASYACPRPGQYTTLVGATKEPELDGKMLFAGEHVSEEHQGYMNGAVETGNRAAATILSQVRGHGREYDRVPSSRVSAEVFASG